MTVLIKYPHQTKEGNKDFFKRKNQELTDLDWAKWAGWFDTDGSFEVSRGRGVRKTIIRRNATLRLKDRQPIELFSKIFEGSLSYNEYKTITPQPYRKEYMAQVYTAKVCGEKAIWFTKNVFPYLIKEEKKDYAAKLLGYKPESKNFTNWTAAEITHYLATALEGDGSVQCRSSKKTKYLTIRIKSSDIQYLSDIKYITEKKLTLTSNLREHSTYKTRAGIKTKSELFIHCSQRNPDNLDFFQNLIKDNVMTLDRKKQRIQEFVTYIS